MPWEFGGGLEDLSVCFGEDFEGEEGVGGRLISTCLTGCGSGLSK